MIIWLLAIYTWLTIHRPPELVEFLAIRQIEQYQIIYAYTGFLVAVWLFGLISGTKRIPSNIFTLGLVLYTLAIVFATLFSPYTTLMGSRHLWIWTGYFIVFVIMITSVKTEKDLKIIVTGFTVAVFISMMDAFRSGFTMRGVGLEQLIGSGTAFRDPNYYGTLLVSALPFLMPLFVLCKRFWHYLFALGYVLLALRVLMLTGSRGAFVAFMALMFFLIVFSRHRFKLLPILLIAGMIGWTVMPETHRNRYRTIWSEDIEGFTTQEIRTATGTKQARIDGLWRGLETWKDHPIFGTGPGQYAIARVETHNPHNLYGQIAAELGTVGIVAFVFMLSCFGINHYSIWKNYKYLQEKALAKEGRYCWWVSIGVMYALLLVLVGGLSLDFAYLFYWIWFGTFHALAAMIMQEKVYAALTGKLLPSL